MLKTPYSTWHKRETDSSITRSSDVRQRNKLLARYSLITWQGHPIRANMRNSFSHLAANRVLSSHTTQQIIRKKVKERMVT